MAPKAKISKGDANVFVEAIRKSTGSGIIVVVVSFVIVSVSIRGHQGPLYALAGIVLIGLIFTFILEWYRVTSEQHSRTAAQRMIAFEIKDAIQANLDGDSQTLHLLYAELAIRFKEANGLDGDKAYSSFISGIGEQMASVQEGSLKKARAVMGAMAPAESDLRQETSG